MKEGHNKIDDLFKSALDDYSKEPSSEVLKNLNKKMFFKDIISLNFKNIFTKSIFKYAGFILIGVSTFFLSTYIYNNHSTNTNNTISQNLLISQNENNSIRPVFGDDDSIDNKPVLAQDLNSKKEKNSERHNLNIAGINDSNNNFLNNKQYELKGNNTSTDIIADNTRLKTTNYSENKLSNKGRSSKAQNNNSVGIKNKKELIGNEPNDNAVLKKDKEMNLDNKKDSNTIMDKDKIDLNVSDFKNKKESFLLINPNEEKNEQYKSDSSQKNYYMEDYKNKNYNITILPSNPVTSVKKSGEKSSNNFNLSDNKKKDHFIEEQKETYMIIPKYTFELYGGSDYVNKILSSPQNSYIDERKNIEKSIFTYNFGADIKYNIKNMFVLTGVNKSVYGENITITSISQLLDSSASHYNFEYHQIIEIDTIGWTIHYDSLHIDSIPILDSLTFNIKDSSWVSIYDSVNKENKNKYKNRISYFEIPLMLGFNFGKVPFRFNVATGVSFGFLTNSDGKLIKPYSNDIADFNENNFPFSKILYNYMLRAGCNYSLNNRWGLFIRAAFKYNLNSIFDKTYPVNQKYYTIGLQGGISVNL